MSWGAHTYYFWLRESPLAEMKTLNPCFDLILCKYLLTKLLSKYLYFTLTQLTFMIQFDFSTLNKMQFWHLFSVFIRGGVVLFVLFLLVFGAFFKSYMPAFLGTKCNIFHKVVKWFHWIIWKKFHQYWKNALFVQKPGRCFIALSDKMFYW